MSHQSAKKADEAGVLLAFSRVGFNYGESHSAVSPLLKNLVNPSPKIFQIVWQWIAPSEIKCMTNLHKSSWIILCIVMHALFSMHILFWCVHSYGPVPEEKICFMILFSSKILVLFIYSLVHSRFSINNYLTCKYVIKKMMINKLWAEITSFSYSLLIAIEITCAIISMCLIKSLQRVNLCDKQSTFLMNHFIFRKWSWCNSDDNHDCLFENRIERYYCMR